MRRLLAVILSLISLAQIAASRQTPAVTARGELEQKARAALAQTSGRIELSGLAKPVEVLRDHWGIPHIYAQTVEDLFFAQGFVAAQDRLWQMEIWRRTGEGKLAEVLGPQAIERDRFARLLRYRGDMEAEWTSYSPDARRIIESFVRGVNSFIELSRDRLPIEFQLTGIKPEPWTPEVCLTRMAGYIMTRNASGEVLRAQLVRMFGTEKTDELIETDPFKKLEIPEGLDLTGID
ncbi:MAG TPA: penicillin acylase family protein, partial [Blastocatellia bacterium]|nr:penicillin acylase family protein [Blastocatellia bacterium]